MRGETARELGAPAGGRALLPSRRSDASADGANAAGLKPWAALYLLLVTTLVLGLAQHLFVHVPPSAIGAKAWLTFALLAGASALAQLFVVITPRHQSYHTTIVFLIPAALLLPPELLPLIALVQHVPEWLKERYAWYIQSFNIANYALDLLAASASARAIIGAESLLPDPRLRTAVAWVAAAVVLVAGNHVLLALMLRLGRGHSWRSSGLFTFESLSTDLVLATLGIVLTCVWRANGWLAGLALAPLLLIHRSLAVPALEAEARIDAKTGLFNARYFAEALRAELERAERLQQPFSLLMVDLDLLREINNSYGHLAGDAVLQGIGAVFRQELRDEDVAARFGGEEFSVLLPNTSAETALDVAERLRRAVALCGFTVETSLEPIKATISLGVAAFPVHGTSENELIHQADLAVYRAKLQGRNRALLAGPESLLLAEQRRMRPRRLPQREQSVPPPLPRQPRPKEERRRAAVQPQRVSGPRFTSLSRPLAAFVGAVGAAGLAAGAVGMVSGQSRDLLGMLVVCALVSAGQALALESVDGSISVSAVGALAGAALFGTRIALALALATALVDWSARRPPRHRFVFNLGALTLASLCACGVFGLVRSSGFGVVPAGAAAGLGYFATNTGLLSAALALEGKTQLVGIWRERFGWMLPHYLAYGLIGSAIALGYRAVGLYALGVFAIPLLLIRNTQGSYLAHTQRSVEKLRTAAEMIERQNVSLEQANRLLQERSLAAMESLAATVDARDSYTAGHSRRVQQLALAVGKELGLSQAELDVLAAAALFHDIGKLAIPDAILLKPSMLSSDEWKQMRLHAEEGAQIIERLGFLADSVPAIEHHHERWDGTGYPAGLACEEIPLGARIIHVVDALDSMLTERLYRPARPLDEVLREIRTGDGSQFCPRCVLALERVLAPESVAASGSEATESVARDYEKSGRVELPKAQQLSAA